MADKYPKSSGWSRCEIVVDHTLVGDTLTDFPVRVDLSALTDDFWDYVRDGGGEIKITASDGATELPRKVLSCDTGTKTGALIFSADELDPDSDTMFYLHFGKSGVSDYADDDTYGGHAVWSSSYVISSPDGGCTDLSANETDGTLIGTLSAGDSTGLFGAATAFPGSDDYVQIATSGDTLAKITLDAVVKFTSASNCCLFSKSAYSADLTINISFSWNILEVIQKYTGNRIHQYSYSFSTDTWYHIVVGYDRSSLSNVPTAMINGSVLTPFYSSAGYGSFSSSGDIYLGGLTGTGDLTGVLDEVCIVNDDMSGDFSTDWYATEYNNFFSPGSFLTFQNYDNAEPGFTGAQYLVCRIGEIVSTQAVLPDLGYGGMECLPSGLGLGISHQHINQPIGNGGLVCLRAGMGLNNVSVLFPGMGLAGDEAVVNRICAGASGMLTLRNRLSAGPISGQFSVLETILETAYVFAYQQVMTSLADVEAPIYTFATGVYLDGRNITGLCSRVVISQDQASIFNEVVIDSNDQGLYHLADPGTRRGTARIEIQIDGDQHDFLLETRSGSIRDGFSLSGRDVTARESEEYAGKITYEFADGPKTSSEAAADMATVSAVDWDAIDWLLPDDFDFFGAPIDGISMLAAEVGAIVRAQSDGSLLVRNKYTQRPIDLATAEADISYDQRQLMSLRKANVARALYDAVSVSCDQGVEAFVPAMEVEEGAPKTGDTIHIKVFWPAGQAATFAHYSTSGLLRSRGTVTERVSGEVVEFVNSTAEAQYPVFSLDRTEWIGAEGGDISYTPGKTALYLEDDQAFRVAKIGYTTRYERLELRGSSVSQLLAVIFLSAAESAGFLVNVICADSPDDPVYGDVISSNLITSIPVARITGQAYLDDHHHDYEEVTFDAPYDADAADGAICYVNDDEIGGRGNYQIMASDIVIEGPKTYNQVTSRRWTL